MTLRPSPTSFLQSHMTEGALVDAKVGKLHLVERRGARRRVSGRRGRGADDEVEHLLQFGLKQRRLGGDRDDHIITLIVGFTSALCK